MRWSQTFIPTMKEVPAEAEVPSHQLMLRAGLIRQLMAARIRANRYRRTKAAMNSHCDSS